MTLRRTILTLAAAATASAIMAQTPLLDTSRPKKIVEIGVSVGDGISTITQNLGTAVPDVTEFSLTPGNRFTAGLTALMPIRRFFGIGTSIDFSVNNYNWNMTTLDQDGGTLTSLYTSNRYYTVDIPVYMQLSLCLGTRVRWTNDLGMYLSLAAGGDSKTRSYTSWTNSLGQSQVTDAYFKRKYFDDDDPVIFGIKGTDIGLHLATGIVVSDHYMVKAEFRTGFTDLAKNYGVLDVHAHSMSLTFKAAYIF